MKMLIGLTGQTGAGKSVAAQLCRKKGLFVVDCDEVAHYVIQTQELKEKLLSVFSDEIILPDGSIDRKQLAAEAFSNRESTDKLNRTVLPFISKEVMRITAEAKTDAVVLDAPTLIESGLDRNCSIVLAVVADEKIRMQRIIRRDNLTDSEAVSRIRAGRDENFYRAHNAKIIFNNKTEEEFINNFEDILKDVLGGINQ